VELEPSPNLTISQLLSILTSRFFVDDFADFVQQFIGIFILSDRFTFLQANGCLVRINNAQNPN